MNILVLSWRDPRHPLAGGAEQVMHEHMKGWIAAGHFVTFFSSRFSGAKAEEDIDGVHMVRRGSPYLRVHLFAFFWYIFGKHPKFDLVIDEFHGWPFFTPLYVRVPKLAVIQELTREVWFKYPLPFGLNYILGALGFILEPLFFVFYRNVHFMTGSQSAKEELASVGIKQTNVTVVPHGVIIPKQTKIPKKESIPTVMFLGALAKDKGIEDAIKTFGLLNSKGNYQFWVVGKSDKDYMTYLKTLVRKVKIEKKLTFFGYVSQEEKFELLARAHVMINPSIREGWGLVNIEANAMKTPVVAYNSKGLIDSVKDKTSGLICQTNNPQTMASITQKLLTDKNLYSKLSSGAFNWSKQFSWDKSRKLSLDLITKLYNKENK